MRGAGCGVRGAGCGVRGAGCGVRGAGCGVRGAGCGVRGAGCGVPGCGKHGVWKTWGLVENTGSEWQTRDLLKTRGFSTTNKHVETIFFAKK